MASPSPGCLSPSHPYCKHSCCLLRSGASPTAHLWVCRWDCPPKSPGTHSEDGTSPLGLGSHHLLQTRRSTCEPWGDAGDAPAAPSTEFLWLVLPTPTCVQLQGCIRRNSALLAAFVGKGVLKGKRLWEKERDGGITSPFLFMPARLHTEYRRHSIPWRANYRKEHSQSKGWAVLHLIFLIQSHHLGKALLLRGRYKDSQRESSTSGKAGAAWAELWGFPSQGREKVAAARAEEAPPASTNTTLLSGFYFNFTNILPRNQTMRRKK